MFTCQHFELYLFFRWEKVEEGGTAYLEIGEAELCLMEIGRKNGKDPVNLTLVVTDYEGLFRHGVLDKLEALPMSIGNYDYITWSQDYSQLVWHGKMMVHDNFPEHDTPAFAWLSLKTKQDQVHKPRIYCSFENLSSE